MATQTERTAVIEAYWVPGCSSCLRMKEFLEKTGLEYEAINVEQTPGARERLKALGLFAPAVIVGDRVVPGLNLKEIADLIGFDYDAPEMLSRDELKARFDTVASTLCRLIAQIPPEGLEYKSDDRDRTMRSLAGHAGSIMRAFLDVYEGETFNTKLIWAPDSVQTIEDLIAWAQQTKSMFDEWWSSQGYDDPLDRVVDTFWGHHTLHEVFERCVWHPAQHTRQVALFLERLGIVPDRPLSAADLAGLPLPDRIHA